MTSTRPDLDAVLASIALTRPEYDLIVQRLGREPNDVELGIFSAMWSEHCGYKNSKLLLRLFPTDGPRVTVKVGEENAGAGWHTLAEMMANVWFDTCVYHQPGIDLLLAVVPIENVLFASEMVGAVKGVNPDTGEHYDDTRKYIDRAALTAEQQRQVFELNVQRVYPRLKIGA